MSLVNEILYTSTQVENGRNIQDILTHAMTELGELAQEVQIAEGKSYKPVGSDGIVGEALDVIACMVDIIYIHYGILVNEDYMVSLIKPKLEKWKQKDKEIQDKQIVSVDQMGCGYCKYDEIHSHSYPCNSCRLSGNGKSWNDIKFVRKT